MMDGTPSHGNTGGGSSSSDKHSSRSHENDSTNTDTNSKASSTVVSTSTTTTATPHNKNHRNHLLSHSLHENMLQKHHKDDPMEFYTIEAVLGEGSMVRMFL